MDQLLATLTLAFALAAVATTLLGLEYGRARRHVDQRPYLPLADQPPRALRAISAAEVPAEVSRGMARLIGELRAAAAKR